MAVTGGSRSNNDYATSALQSAANTFLASLDSKLANPLPVTGTFWQATQPISASSLPLPTGASTSSLQTTGNTSLSSIDAKTPALGQALAAASTPVVLTAAQLSTLTPLTTVAVTGTFWQTTQPVSIATLPLPTGAATETTLSALNTKVTTTANGIKVDGSAVTQPVSGTFWQATQPVSAASLPLPSGASTSALQTTGNTSLSSIDTKTPALGQALAAASVPVVLTAAQLSTLTPLSTVAVTGTFWQTTQPISASSLPLPTGAATAANQATANTSLSSIDAKTPALGQALASGSVPVVLTSAQLSTLTPLSTVAVTGTFWQSTQPVSVASLPLPSGAATEATLSALNAKVPSNLTVTSTRLLVDGSGVTQPVTGTFWQATQPISAASLPLPSGAATSALQTTGNTSLSNIDGKTPALGQALAAGSVPVVLTAAQLSTLTPLSTVAVTGTFWQATQPISAASLPLPAGASTSALQTTGNTSLASIVAQLPSALTGGGQLKAADVINTAYVNGAISVTTSATEAKVGLSKQVNRKLLVITPTNGIVYRGSSNTVTTSNGAPIFKNQSWPIDVTDNVPVWLIAASTVDVRIEEYS